MPFTGAFVLRDGVSRLLFGGTAGLRGAGCACEGCSWGWVPSAARICCPVQRSVQWLPASPPLVGTVGADPEG